MALSSKTGVLNGPCTLGPGQSYYMDQAIVRPNLEFHLSNCFWSLCLPEDFWGAFGISHGEGEVLDVRCLLRLEVEPDRVPQGFGKVGGESRVGRSVGFNLLRRCVNCGPGAAMSAHLGTLCGGRVARCTHR